MTADTASVTTTTRRPALRRAAYAGLAAGLLALLVIEVGRHGGWTPALLGGLGPDLAMLLSLGGGAALAHGQLHPRAVPAYNAVHRVWGPIVVLAVSASGLVGTGWLVLGLAWAFHIALDRTVGYGLRDSSGFQRTR